MEVRGLYCKIVQTLLVLSSAKIIAWRSVPLPVHVRKRDNGFSWTSFTNNMDILRGHLKEKIEVARRQADRVQSLGELGRK